MRVLHADPQSSLLTMLLVWRSQQDFVVAVTANLEYFRGTNRQAQDQHIETPYHDIE
jgi:hypothetical protein